MMPALCSFIASPSERWRRTRLVANVAPTFLLAVAGSAIVGPALGWVTLQVIDRVQHIPTSIILQFVTTFGVWLLGGATRPVGGVDDGVLCGDGFTDVTGTNAGADSDAHVCGVGDGRFALNVLALSLWASGFAQCSTR